MTERVLHRLFWISGGFLFAIGLIGWYDRLAYGHLHANYGTTVPWGLGVAFYIYFIGLSTGVFLLSAIAFVFNIERVERIGRLAVFVALVTLLCGLLSIWPDIGHMDRAWHIFAYANLKSPMAILTWVYALYLILLVTELWFLLRAEFVARASAAGLQGTMCRLLSLGSREVSAASRARDRQVVRVLAVTGIVMIILYNAAVGMLFGVVAARPHWNSAVYPTHFLLAGLISGGSLLIIATSVFQDGWVKNQDTVLGLGQVVLGLLLLDVFIQLSEMVVTSYGYAPSHILSLKLILGGPFWWVFWIWQVLLGTVIPLLLLVFPTRKDARWVSLAGFLIVFGYFGLRLNIVIPGLAIEEIRGLSEALASARLAPYYFPSATECLLSAWVIGFGLLLFGLGQRLLPLKQENEESHVRA